jgi:hypothetical protein
MAGLDPAIHDLIATGLKTWMPGTRPGMTLVGVLLRRDDISDQQRVFEL